MTNRIARFGLIGIGILAVILALLESSPAPRAVAASAVPNFDHIFIILMENHSYNEIIGNTSEAPYINQLAGQYGVAADYFAATHPSLPNYLALTGGDTFGITSDCTTCWIDAPNIAVDRVEPSGRTWRGYMESMPSPCYIGDSSPYAQKHDPFIYYNDVRQNSAECNNVVPYTQLSSDIASASTTPNFVWITPNLCDDMHDCSISTGDTWLSQNVPTILNSPAFTSQNSLLLITWDEDDGSQNNQVATLVIAPSVPAGFQSSTYYTHYSVLATIEQAWGLAPLTSNDANASAMSDFFPSTGSATPTITPTDTPTTVPTATITPTAAPSLTTTPTVAATGAPSVTATITPASAVVPGAPTNVTATAGMRSAQVSWQPPGDDGGCPVTSFTVTDSNGSTTTVEGTTTSVTITRLSFRETYTFTVSATNCVGTGPASSPSNPIRPRP